jgi:hypothetical protein
MKQLTCFIILVFLGISSCAPAQPEPTQTPTPTNSPTFTPKPTITPKPTETQQPTSTIDPELVENAESDLNPKDINEVDVILRGTNARIVGGIIIDESFPWFDNIEIINPQQYAEYGIAWPVYMIWRKYGVELHMQPATEENFRLYIKLVEDVQNGLEDPMKIAVRGPANNTLTEGYQVDKYYFVPWSEGVSGVPEAYEGVRVISLRGNYLTLVGNTMHNVSYLSSNELYAGLNFEKTSDYEHSLYFYASTYPTMPSGKVEVGNLLGYPIGMYTFWSMNHAGEISQSLAYTSFTLKMRDKLNGAFRIVR